MNCKCSEVDAEAELHVAWNIGLTGDFAEVRGTAQTETRRATELYMVQDVCDLKAEGRANASFFPDPDVLQGRGIDIPGGLGSDVAVATTTGIETEDAWPEFRDYGGWVAEQITPVALFVPIPPEPLTL